MNEELQNALAELINSTMGVAGDAKEFLMAETPEVIQQLLTWKAVESFIYFMIAFLMILAGIILISKAIIGSASRVEKARSDYKEGKAWTRYGGNSDTLTSEQFDFVIRVHGVKVHYAVCGGLLLFIGALATNLTWAQIWLAPKVYLLEYAANMVN